MDSPRTRLVPNAYHWPQKFQINRSHGTCTSVHIWLHCMHQHSATPTFTHEYHTHTSTHQYHTHTNTDIPTTPTLIPYPPTHTHRPTLIPHAHWKEERWRVGERARPGTATPPCTLDEAHARLNPSRERMELSPSGELVNKHSSAASDGIYFNKFLKCLTSIQEVEMEDM